MYLDEKREREGSQEAREISRQAQRVKSAAREEDVRLRMSWIVIERGVWKGRDFVIETGKESAKETRIMSVIGTKTEIGTGTG